MGLGISSSLVNYRWPAGFSYVTPSLSKAPSPLYFQPITAFDSLLFVQDKSIAKLVGKIHSVERYAESNPILFLERFLMSSELHDAAKEIFDLLSTDNLSARVGQLDMPLSWIMNQEGKFTDFYAKDSPENYHEIALMMESGQQTLQAIRWERDQTFAFGPHLRKVLENIGYRTYSAPIPSKFDINTRFGTIAYSQKEAMYKNHLDSSVLRNTFDDVNELMMRHSSSMDYLDDNVFHDL